MRWAVWRGIEGPLWVVSSRGYWVTISSANRHFVHGYQHPHFSGQACLHRATQTRHQNNPAWGGHFEGRSLQLLPFFHHKLKQCFNLWGRYHLAVPETINWPEPETISWPTGVGTGPQPSLIARACVWVTPSALEDHHGSPVSVALLHVGALAGRRASPEVLGRSALCHGLENMDFLAHQARFSSILLRFHQQSTHIANG